MSKQVNWNKIIYDEFIRLAILTDDEKKVLETRLKNYTRIQQAEMLSFSVATIDRIIKSLKINMIRCNHIAKNYLKGDYR